MKKIPSAQNKKTSQKIHKNLLKKIHTEVKKLNFSEKTKIIDDIQIKLEKLLWKKNLSPLFIQNRIKAPQDLVDKIVRKIHYFYPDNSSFSLKDLMKNIRVENIRKNIFDIMGLRLIFSHKKECYDFFRILKNSSLFEIIEKENQDYISNPKSNGYQALHIVIKDKKSQKYFELQILTFDMNLNSAHGAANREKYHQHRKQKFTRNIFQLYSYANSDR